MQLLAPVRVRIGSQRRFTSKVLGVVSSRDSNPLQSGGGGGCAAAAGSDGYGGG